MADGDRPTFRIRRIPESEPRRRPEAPPEPPAPVPPTDQPPPPPAAEAAPPAADRAAADPAATDTAPTAGAATDAPVPDAAPADDTAAPASTATGGLFNSPAGVLSFLAAIAGSRLTDAATCRRGDDGQWWADVEVPWDSAASYVRTAGGRPYEAIGERWLEIPILDTPTAATREAAPVLDVAAWTQVELAELMTTLPLRRGRFAGSPALDVVVSGALGRWVLRRATALGLEARIATARCRPLRGDGPDSGVLLIRLQAERGTIPLSLVQALSSLPYTVVGRPMGPAGGSTADAGERLLVDVRYRPPLVETLLAAMIPEGEMWILAGPDVGHWRLSLTGELIDGAELLDAPAISVADAPISPEARRPSPLPVRLVPRAGRQGPYDAVLLDDDELVWLQRFLMTRPSGERAFVIPGGGRHLLAAPGGLTSTVPFGVTLRRIGPGGLYVETGLDFFPPLPPGARRDVFALDDQAVVAVASDGAYRFPLERLIPAWSLWVGEAPEIREEMSTASAALLDRIAEILSRDDVERELRRERPTAKPLDEEDRSQLLEEAQRAEMRGELVEAAGLLEKAGELGPAGRLYERAATAGH